MNKTVKVFQRLRGGAIVFASLLSQATNAIAPSEQPVAPAQPEAKAAVRAVAAQPERRARPRTSASLSVLTQAQLQRIRPRARS